jgi:rifampicin phosphotransferase
MTPLEPPRSHVLRGLWRDAAARGEWQMAERIGLPAFVLDGSTAPGAVAFAWRRRFHGPTRRALARAAQAFDAQPWRDELARWDETVRPELVMQGLRLAATAPAQLSDAELAGFLDRCLAYVAAAVEAAAGLALAGGIVHADFARACARWTGGDGVDLAALFPPEGVLRAGARHELGALREAMLDVPPETLPFPASAGPADELLLALAQRRDAFGRAVRAYLDRVRLRVLAPLDVDSLTVWEAPDGVVAVLEELARNLGRAAVGSGARARIAAVRERVPERARPDFEALVAQARAVQRLLEEPVHMTLAWGLGVLRHGLLHAGERLVRSGRLDEPGLIFAATAQELPELLAGRGPDALTLRARRAQPAEPREAPRLMPAQRLPVPARRLAAAAERYFAGPVGARALPGEA